MAGTPQYGVHKDVANSRVAVNYAGSPGAYVDASGLTVPTGKALAVTDGVARAQLAAETAIYPLAIRTHQGGSLAVSEAAGTLFRSVSSNVELLKGEVTDNTTKTDIATAQIVLPETYVAGGAITVRFRCALIKTGTPTNNGSSLDMEAYKSDGSGAVGSDICATAAQTFAALDTWYNKDFTITPTGLVAGDRINLKITAAVIDSEVGAGTITFNLETPTVLLAIKG